MSNRPEVVRIGLVHTSAEGSGGQEFHDNGGLAKLSVQGVKANATHSRLSSSGSDTDSLKLCAKEKSQWGSWIFPILHEASDTFTNIRIGHTEEEKGKHWSS